MNVKQTSVNSEAIYLYITEPRDGAAGLGTCS